MTGTNPLVLIVDDEQAIRRFLRISLTNAGYRTQDVATGEGALRVSAAEPPELILLDLGLPDMDGQEVLHRLLAVSGVAARVETDPARFRAVDLPLLQGDPGRLRALGWERRRSVEEALADLWAETAGPVKVRAAES